MPPPRRKRQLHPIYPSIRNPTCVTPPMYRYIPPSSPQKTQPFRNQLESHDVAAPLTSRLKTRTEHVYSILGMVESRKHGWGTVLYAVSGGKIVFTARHDTVGGRRRDVCGFCVMGRQQHNATILRMGLDWSGRGVACTCTIWNILVCLFIILDWFFRLPN